MEVKGCSKCKSKLPATKEYFYVDKRLLCGLRSKCKICIKEYKTTEEYRKKNKEKSSDWRNNNPEKYKDQYRKWNKARKKKYKDNLEYRTRILKLARGRNKKGRDSLSDWYIRRVLLTKNKQLQVKDINNNMICTQRLIIQLKRELNIN